MTDTEPLVSRLVTMVPPEPCAPSNAISTADDDDPALSGVTDRR